MKYYLYILSVKKLLVLPLKYLLYFFSGYMVRDKNIWVFGSFGLYNDNSRYLYEYVGLEGGGRCIWISRNRRSVEIAVANGCEAYYAWSLKGIYYCLKAKVYVYSAYVSDINFFTSKNAILVNLWHGIPLKKIEFDINTKPLVDLFKNATSLNKFIRPALHVKPCLLLSPSKYVADYSFKSAFRVDDDRIIIHSYPRVIYLKKCEPISELRFNNKFVFLYAPTWRDNGENILLNAKVNLKELDLFLEENDSVMIFKFHPNTKIDFSLSEIKNIRICDNLEDPCRVMKSADCLITDYSSIYFDYLFLNRPIIFFSFDKEQYLENREMYFNYDDVTPGEHCNSFSDLLGKLLKIKNGIDDFYEKRQLVHRLFNDNDNNNDVNIIIDAIKNNVIATKL